MPNPLAAYAQRLNQSTALRHFGARVSFPEAGDRVVVELNPVLPEHRGGMSGTSAVNGGVLAALFDLVTGCASALVDPEKRSATVQLSMSFEQPVLGDVVRAEGRVNRAGKRTLFVSAEILDGQGQVCARCQGITQMAKVKWPMELEG